jgi:hypothetical protein
MGSAIVSLILVALMITTGLGFSRVAINSVDDLSQSWKAAQKASLDETRTNFSLVRADVGAGVVNVYLKNTGLLQLACNQNWDIIAQYYDENGKYIIKNLDYISSLPPGPNNWAMQLIYANDSLRENEVFQPGIVDSGEVAKLVINLWPAPKKKQIGWIVISTEKGLTGSIQFQG